MRKQKANAASNLPIRDCRFNYCHSVRRYKSPDKVGTSSTDGRFSKKDKTEDLLAALNETPSDLTDNPTSKSEADDFYYYPSSVQIPDIDVPEFLPDLPG